MPSVSLWEHPRADGSDVLHDPDQLLSGLVTRSEADLVFEGPEGAPFIGPENDVRPVVVVPIACQYADDEAVDVGEPLDFLEDTLGLRGAKRLEPVELLPSDQPDARQCRGPRFRLLFLVGCRRLSIAGSQRVGRSVLGDRPNAVPPGFSRGVRDLPLIASRMRILRLEG
jgi:hypothetical protein